MVEQLTTLGEALRAVRAQLDWSTPRMALAAGVPHETYLSLEADTALPAFAHLAALGRLLDASPLQIDRMVGRSARRILSCAMERAAGQRPAVAARRRGTVRRDADEALWASLPPPLRRTLAEESGADASDPAALGSALRGLAKASATRRHHAIEAMVAALELEGDPLPLGDLSDLTLDEEDEA